VANVSRRRQVSTVFHPQLEQNSPRELRLVGNVGKRHTVVGAERSWESRSLRSVRKSQSETVYQSSRNGLWYWEGLASIRAIHIQQPSGVCSGVHSPTVS
jgi:hypothetical protein